MHKEHQGLQSTKVNKLNLTEQTQELFPPSDFLNNKTNHVCYVLVNLQKIATGYLNLTGRFLRRSSRGNRYILVVYHCNANLIKAMSLKNCWGQTIIEAWQSMRNEFKRAGESPKVHVLNNEKSKDLIVSFATEMVDYQLVAPC